MWLAWLLGLLARRRAASGGGGPGTLSFVASATANAADITIPASAQEGDLAILFDSPNGSPQPSYVLPSGWTELAHETDSDIDNTRRTVISRRVLGAGEGGASITGMSGSGTSRKIMLVFRPTGSIGAVTRQDYASEWTSGNPAGQTANGASGAVPLIVLAHWRAGNAISPRTASPAVTEVTANNTHFAGYAIYNSSPADHAFDMDDEGGANLLQSFYLEVS